MSSRTDLLLVCADPREGAALDALVGRRPFVVGVGKATAACQLAARLARHEVGAVLAFGVGGALPAAPSSRPLELLQLVVVVESVLADEGVESPDGFLDLAALGLGEAVVHRHDQRLAAAAARALGGLELVRAATVSTCSGTDARAQAIATRTGARLETMESAALALVCATFAVPFVELRCVSNATGDRTRAAFAIPAACTRVQTAVATLLEQDTLALAAAPRPTPR
ncbi:MAG: futalosine hydrolase [Planctomycetes bacterium]|nr:futalosine hydrolase [Planctomycetota bacterium]